MSGEKSDSRKRKLWTIRKESSAEDDLDLYKERQSSLVPLTSSPYEEKDEPPPTPEPEVKFHPDELKVYVSEIPWGDLLLEIAMTTAFASLTDGTPILQASNVTSYLSFFAMVWWVWASQVAYNVRFRQSDWLHRFFVFLQLLVFCALAAFTNNFDITNGIANDNLAQKQLLQVQLSDFDTQQDVAAANYRNNRLPTLNARGISVTMALSRVVLLLQYALALYHVPRRTTLVDGSRPGAQVRQERRPPRAALFLHIGTLVLSTLCYLVAYGVIGKAPNEGDQIAKLFLWYCPLLVEVAAHFIAASLPGRVRYPAAAIYARSSTVFIIILGGGLDKITNGFQYIVGNVSVGWESAGLILCAAVIFILQFTLYFGTSEGDKLGSRRALALFFFHYFYLSALIVTLQGIAALLSFGNLGPAMELPFSVVKEFSAKLNSTPFGTHFNESNFSDLEHPFNKSGIALSTYVESLNWGIDAGVNMSDPLIPYYVTLQDSVSIMYLILSNFNSAPDRDSLLYSQMSAFFDNDPWNQTVVKNETYFQIVQEVITARATPALWFYAAGGSTLFTLSLMCLINRWPRDKYEWGQTISRLILGSFLIALSALDVHAQNTIIDENFNYTGSRIWYLAGHNLVLPPYAFALILEQAVELVLLYMAGRAYGQQGFHVFWQKVRSVGPNGPMTSESQSKRTTLESAYDPYKPYSTGGIDSAYYPAGPNYSNKGCFTISPPANAPQAFVTGNVYQPLVAQV